VCVTVIRLSVCQLLHVDAADDDCRLCIDDYEYDDDDDDDDVAWADDADTVEKERHAIQDRCLCTTDL